MSVTPEQLTPEQVMEALGRLDDRDFSVTNSTRHEKHARLAYTVVAEQYRGYGDTTAEAIVALADMVAPREKTAEEKLRERCGALGAWVSVDAPPGQTSYSASWMVKHGAANDSWAPSLDAACQAALAALDVLCPEDET